MDNAEVKQLAFAVSTTPILIRVQNDDIGMKNGRQCCSSSKLKKLLNDFPKKCEKCQLTTIRELVRALNGESGLGGFECTR